MKLAELEGGERGRIVRVEMAGAIGQRLLAVGLVEGAEVTVVRRAPLGDPLQLTCPGGQFALRRRDAAMIEVALLGAATDEPRGGAA